MIKIKNFNKYIIIISVSILLFSCYNIDDINSNSSTSAEVLDDSTDPYYYYGMNRINMFTGAITSLCSDPLCNHKTESCPLYYYDYNIDTAKIYNNKYLFYISFFSRFRLMKLYDPNAVGTNKIFAYDIENNKLSVIYEFDDMYDLYNIRKVRNGNYLYYIFGLNTEKTVENSDIHKFYIIEVNINTASAKLIYSGEVDSIYTLILHVNNNRIYWKKYISTNEVVYFTTDYNGNNIEYIDKIKSSEFYAQNGYIYYTDDSTENYKKTSLNLYRHNYNTGKTETVFKNHSLVDWAYSGEYLYYRDDSKIYRIKNDGFDEEFVMDYSDIIDSFHISNDDFKGDYMCIPVFEKNYETKYAGLDALGQTSYLIINQKTLEYKLVH